MFQNSCLYNLYRVSKKIVLGNHSRNYGTIFDFGLSISLIISYFWFTIYLGISYILFFIPIVSLPDSLSPIDVCICHISQLSSTTCRHNVALKGLFTNFQNFAVDSMSQRILNIYVTCKMAPYVGSTTYSSECSFLVSH